MIRSFARMGLVATVLGFTVNSAHAALVITEAMSSSGTGGTPDWFEITNTGPAAVSITGYKMDDNSNTFANAVPLSGITNIANGESVVFVETDAPVTDLPSFRTFWGGTALTAQIGSYPSSGLGVSLGSGGDAVNLFDSAGNAAATSVTFGAATAGTTFIRANNNPSGAFGSVSVNGTNYAFTSTGTPANIGSPGIVTPEPASLATLLGAGLLVRRRRTI